jgi:uncharacterized protein (TIGR03083 family)
VTIKDDLALVDMLDDVWTSIDQLGSVLDEADWKKPTELPGWTVQDNLVHLSAIESMSLGRPWEGHHAADLTNVKNDIGRSNENAVDSRRGWSGADCLAEFHSLTRERVAQLRGLDEDGFGADSWTPRGPGTVRTLLPFRIFDSWVHEQDMRRAVGREGDLDSAAARHTLGQIADAMPFVVGKKVAPPDGSTVVFSVGGAVPLEIGIEVTGGRAARVDPAPADPTAFLGMSSVTFERLACGRIDPDAALAAGDVRLDGDTGLGRRIVAEMNYMF